MRSSPVTDHNLDILRQCVVLATQRASNAMCDWTGGRISLSVDEVRRAPLEELAMDLDGQSELMTIVVLGIAGCGGGQMILTFDHAGGRRLAASLLRREIGQSAMWSDLEQSAIMETGNILASAYLSELTRLTGRTLRPTPPTFIQDYGASVLEQTLMLQALECDEALVCQTRFKFDREDVDWSVFIVPGKELLQALQQGAVSVC
ncbi:MAG: chemotaxis protein CheC [Pirellulales bacterium]|nr:chemotaxis protein CheC [Pirellulales bacterium]